MLLSERREAEARAAELRAQQEARLIEESQRWHASLPRGIPWWKVPAGVSPAQALAMDEYASRPRSAYQQMLDAELSGQPSGLLYHSMQDDVGES